MKQIFSAIVLFVFAVSAAADTFLLLDLSKGMRSSEYKEAGRLTYVYLKQDKSIYNINEHVYTFAFKQSILFSGRPFVYYPKNKNEGYYKKAQRKHLSFFKKIRRGIKSPRKDRINANVVFVVDTSGSMVSKKRDYLSDVKFAMQKLVRNKSPKARVSIVTFDGKKFMKNSARSKIIADNITSKEELLKKIASIKVSRYDTYLGSGLQKAFTLLPRNSKRKSVVMIFTDGNEINDFQEAKREFKKFKRNNIDVKVVAVGGANVSMLKEFSTSGYVFNATSNDLQDIIKQVSTNSDEIFLAFDNFFGIHQPKKGDRIIIYSSMQNIDAVSDFTLVPNVASKAFYEELKKQNKARGINIRLDGVDVYVRVIGEQRFEDVKKLKLFWGRFFKDTGANLKFFADTTLQKEDL